MSSSANNHVSNIEDIKSWFTGFSRPSQRISNSKEVLNAPGVLRIVGRNDFLFAFGVVAVIAGMLFPQAPVVFDILLIFSVCLTAAVLIIPFSAQRALEVTGFSLLIILATTLRMTLSVASVKLILLRGQAGSVSGIAGGILVGSHYILAVLILAAAAVFVFVFIYKAVKKIIRIAAEFTAEVFPVRQISINSDIEAGIIDKSQARDLQKNNVRETCFFVAMTGAAGFMLSAAVIELLIVVVFALGTFAKTVSFSTNPELPAETYAAFVFGTGLLTQISALITAAASVYLVRKSSETSIADDRISEEDFNERIKTVASEVRDSNFSDDSAASENVDKRSIGMSYTPAYVTHKNIIIDDLQWQEESENAVEQYAEAGLDLWKWQKNTDNKAYEAIADLIESKSSDAASTTLMAADSVKNLGVTVPVNVAVRLAKRGKRCLLIDLDFERAAVLRVFDIDVGHDAAVNKVIPTSVNNLSVYSIPENNRTEKVNITEIIASFQNQYEYLIVYAPDIKFFGSAEQVSACITHAMFFGDGDESNGSEVREFQSVLKSNKCKILNPQDIFAQA